MKKISIIIPVYNTEKQLERCLTSICNQTYSNLEIICVDDGSTDGSEDVVDLFAGKDNRIIVVHQKNAGESNARNTGLKMATGDYITFCDCDDWLELDMYETMMQEAEKERLDMVCVSWYKDTVAESVEIKNAMPVSSDVFEKNQLLEYIYLRDSYRGFAYMWDKIYKVDVLKEADGSLLLFDENLRLGGDVLYLAKAALNTRRAKYIDKSYYHYVQREESGCHTKDTSKLRDWLKAYEMVIALFEQEKVDDEILSYVKRFLAYHSSNATEIAILQNEKTMKVVFQSFMRQYKDDYIRLNQQYPQRIERYMELLEE